MRRASAEEERKKDYMVMVMVAPSCGSVVPSLRGSRPVPVAARFWRWVSKGESGWLPKTKDVQRLLLEGYS